MKITCSDLQVDISAEEIVALLVRLSPGDANTRLAGEIEAMKDTLPDPDPLAGAGVGETKSDPKRGRVLKKVDVLVKDDWVTFDSISAAAKAIGVLYNNLTIALRKGKDCKGHKVRYSNPELDACLAEIEAKNRQPYQPSKPFK